MTAFVALLRAVNVGGTGKLPIRDLVALCEAAGFTQVKTYIASGNAVFASKKSETQVKAELERALLSYAGKPVGVCVRACGRGDGERDREQSFSRCRAQPDGCDLP